LVQQGKEQQKREEFRSTQELIVVFIENENTDNLTQGSKPVAGSHNMQRQQPTN